MVNCRSNSTVKAENPQLDSPREGWEVDSKYGDANPAGKGAMGRGWNPIFLQEDMGVEIYSLRECGLGFGV